VNEYNISVDVSDDRVIGFRLGLVVGVADFLNLVGLIEGLDIGLDVGRFDGNAIFVGWLLGLLATSLAASAETSYMVFCSVMIDSDDED